MHFPILPYINEHGISLMDQKAHFVDGYCPNLQVLADEDYQLLISPKQLKRADLLLACAPNFFEEILALATSELSVVKMSN